MANIFTKSRLTPEQFKAVADRRFDDARWLCDSRQNARANGAMYLGGFVVECLLKAGLLTKHPWLQNTSRTPTKHQWRQRLTRLLYSHDLDEILAELPEVSRRLVAADPSGSLLASLKNVCQRWTIFARYSPQSATFHEAAGFPLTIKELKKWLA